jgi:hypothetical protein
MLEVVGVSKGRTTVSVDEELLQYYQNDPSVNLSGLVENLLQEYADSGGNTDSLLKMREQQLESDLEELGARYTAKWEEYERVCDRLEERERRAVQVPPDVLEEALNVFNGEAIEVMEPGDAPAEHWAGKARVSEEVFVTQLKEAYNDA